MATVSNLVSSFALLFPTFLITAVLADYYVLSRLFHVRHKLFFKFKNYLLP